MPDNKDKISKLYNIIDGDSKYKGVFKDENELRSVVLNPVKSGKFFKLLDEDPTYKGVFKDYNNFVETFKLGKYNTLPQLPGAMTQPDNSVRKRVEAPTPLSDIGKDEFIDKQSQIAYLPTLDTAFRGKIGKDSFANGQEKSKTGQPVQEAFLPFKPVEFTAPNTDVDLKGLGASIKPSNPELKDAEGIGGIEILGEEPKPKTFFETQKEKYADYYRSTKTEGYINTGVEFNRAWSDFLVKGTKGLLSGMRDAVGGTIEMFGGDPQADISDPNVKPETFAEKAIRGLDDTDAYYTALSESNSLPDDLAGKTTKGIIGALPLIASLYSGTGVTSLLNKPATVGRIIASNVFNPLTKILIAQGALSAYGDARSQGESVGDSSIESGKAGYEGLKGGLELTAMGGIAGRLTPVIMEKLAVRGLIAGTGVLTEKGTHALIMGAGGGGFSIASDVLSGNDIDMDKAIEQATLFLAFEIPGLGKGIAKEIGEKVINSKTNSDVLKTAKNGIKDNDVLSVSAVKTFIATDLRDIDVVNKTNGSHQELLGQSLNFGMEALDSKDSQTKVVKFKNQSITQKMSDIKYVTEIIVKNREAFLESIAELDVAPEVKQEFIDKVEAVYKNNAPTEINKQALAGEILQKTDRSKKLDEVIKNTKDPIEKSEAEAEKQELDANIEELNGQLGKIAKAKRVKKVKAEKAEVVKEEVISDVESKETELKKLQDELDSFSNEYNSLADAVNKEDRSLNTPKSENEIKLNELQDKINKIRSKRDAIEQSLSKPEPVKVEADPVKTEEVQKAEPDLEAYTKFVDDALDKLSDGERVYVDVKNKVGDIERVEVSEVSEKGEIFNDVGDIIPKEDIVLPKSKSSTKKAKSTVKKKVDGKEVEVEVTDDGVKPKVEITEEVVDNDSIERTEERELSRLEDKVNDAKKNISRSDDTDAAIKEYNDAVKEKTEYEDSVNKRKQDKADKRDLEVLIEDEISSVNDTSRRYDLKEAFDKDPRLAALERAKDMLEFAESGDLKDAYLKQGRSEKDATKDVERAINGDKRDIKLLEDSLAKNPVKEVVKVKPKVEVVPKPVKEAPKVEVVPEPVKEAPKVEVVPSDVTMSKEETFNNMMRGRKKRNQVDLKDKETLQKVAEIQRKLMAGLEFLRKYGKDGNREALVKKFKSVVKSMYDSQSLGLLPTDASKGYPKDAKSTSHFEKSAEDILAKNGISYTEIRKLSNEARMELAKEIDVKEYNNKYFGEVKVNAVSDAVSDTVKIELEAEPVKEVAKLKENKPKTNNTKKKNESVGQETKPETKDRTPDDTNKGVDKPVGTEKETVQKPSKGNGDKVLDSQEVVDKAQQDLTLLKGLPKDKKQLKHQKSVERLIAAKAEGKLSNKTFDELYEKFNQALPEKDAKIKIQENAEKLKKLYEDFRKAGAGTLSTGINAQRATIAVQIIFAEAKRIYLNNPLPFKSVAEFKKFLKRLRQTNTIPQDVYDEVKKDAEIVFERVNATIEAERLKAKGSVFAQMVVRWKEAKKRVEKEKSGSNLWDSFKKNFVLNNGKIKSLAEAEASFKLGDLSISPTAANEFKKALDNKAGVSARVARDFEAGRESILGKLGSASNPLLSSKLQDLLAQYVDIKSTIELDERMDAKSKKRKKHSQELNKEVAEEMLREIESKSGSVTKEYGEYDPADIAKRAQNYFDYMHKLLEKRKEAGLINDAAYQVLNDIKFYSPRSFVEHLEMNGRSATGGGDNAAIGSLKGGSYGDKVTNISKLMQDATEGVESAVARNIQSRAFWDMMGGGNKLSFAQKAPLSPAYIKDLAIEAKNKKEALAAGVPYKFKYIKPRYRKTPKDMTEVDFIGKDGKPLRAWVKTEVHDQLGAIPKLFEGLDSKAFDAVKFIFGSGLTRSLATSANPEFTLVNAVRDVAFIFMTTNQYSSALPVFAGQIVKDMWTVGGDALKRKGRFNDMISQYGAREYISGREMKTTSGGYTGREVIWNRAKNILLYLSESSEILTRLALRERVIKNKVSMMEKAGEVVTQEAMKQIESDASYEAANYIDFSQGGKVSKAINEWIPFFNAGIQGTRKTFESAAKDPVLFAAKATQIVLISMLGYYYNNSDDERSEFYQKQVPEYIKNNYHVIMSPFSHVDEADGKTKYTYVKIPKSQDQQILGTFGESLSNKLLYEVTGEQKYKDAIILSGDRVMASIKGAVSLLPDANMLPPFVKAAVAYGWNYDTFRMQKVYAGDENVSDGLKSDKRTMKFLKDLGKWQYENNIPLEIAPAQVQGAFKAMIPTKNIWFDGLAAIGSIGDLTKSKQDLEEAKTGFDWKKLPGARRFVDKTEDRPDYKGIEEANIKAGSERKLNADEIDEAYVKVKKGEMSLSDMRTLVKQVAEGDAVERERLLDIVMTNRKSDKSEQRSDLSVIKRLFKSTDASSQYFFKEWQRLDEDGKKALVRDLKRADIYNDAFAYKWRKLKNSQ
jgi:hypothetical protein